ncbi:unnamed protein product [Rhizoctonia solani]|uniref:Uncharacterized protein n=1 Tax=Rhizoctonia solani TaxID=456999 RepID=A0A8H3D4A6_9AGAM|nr:unnamed protein product [Rhizoctonia solani]
MGLWMLWEGDVGGGNERDGRNEEERLGDGVDCGWTEICVNSRADFVSFYRPRVPPRLVNVTPRPTRSVADAAIVPSTVSTRVSKIIGYHGDTPHSAYAACAQCGYPSAKLRSYEWGQKAKRRKTTGTGRMRYLKEVSRRFKNGFRCVH